MKIKINVNGTLKIFEVKPDEYLLDTLKNKGYASVRRGCDTTSCGVCTVLLNGNPIASCSYLSCQAADHNVTTVEGIPKDAALIADCFGHEGADQCGYCNPSMALTLYAMKRELKNPTDDDIRSYLVGNLCRCSGYVAQHRAIRAYLEVE